MTDHSAQNGVSPFAAMTPTDVEEGTTAGAAAVGFANLIMHGIDLEARLAAERRAHAMTRGRLFEASDRARFFEEEHGKACQKIAEKDDLLYEGWALLANGAADPVLPTSSHSVWPEKRNEWRDRWHAQLPVRTSFDRMYEAAASFPPATPSQDALCKCPAKDCEHSPDRVIHPPVQGAEATCANKDHDHSGSSCQGPRASTWDDQ